MDLSIRIGALPAEKSPHRGERVLRVRHRVRGSRRSLVARRRSREGAVSRGARRASASPYRRNAGGHAERDRPARHRRPPVHRREDARAARQARGGHRQHLRHDLARVCRAGQDTVGRRRGRCAGVEYLLPQHQRGRHHVRLQPPRHSRCRRRRSCRHAPARDSEADAECHGHQRHRQSARKRPAPMRFRS